MYLRGICKDVAFILLVSLLEQRIAEAVIDAGRNLCIVSRYFEFCNFMVWIRLYGVDYDLMHLGELAPHPCSGPTSFSFSQTRVDDFSARF